MSEQAPGSSKNPKLLGFLNRLSSRRQVDVPVQDVPPRIYPPRTEQLHCKVRQNAAGARIQVPDQAVLDEITQSSTNIHYWPTNPAFEASTDPRIDYWKYVAEPLLGHLLQKYPDKQLSVRAALISINGTFPEREEYREEYDFPPLYDIAEAVAKGSDKHPSHPYFNVAPLRAEDDGGVLFTTGMSHVSEFADSVSVARFDLGDTEPDRAAALFAGLFVYDGNGLQDPVDKDGNLLMDAGAWARSIRTDMDPSQVLLEAYILDASL